MSINPVVLIYLGSAAMALSVLTKLMLGRQAQLGDLLRENVEEQIDWAKKRARSARMARQLAEKKAAEEKEFAKLAAENEAAEKARIAALRAAARAEELAAANE